MTLRGGYDIFLKTDGDLKPESIGIQQASTFPAFCKLHDSSTFAPIETRPYHPCREHAFLSSYRALCRELFYFKANAHLNLSKFDRGMRLEGQILLQGIAREKASETRLALLSLDQFKDAYDRALMSRDFSDVTFYTVEFGLPPDLMVTSMFAPFVDFFGHRIRTKDVLGTIDDHVIVSLFSSATRGWFQIAWLGASRAGEKFTRSLAQLLDSAVPHAIVRLVFTHFENSYFRPSWWSGLSPDDASYLRKRRWNPTNPFEPEADDYLADDGRRLVNWPVVARHASCSFEAP